MYVKLLSVNKNIFLQMSVSEKAKRNYHRKSMLESAEPGKFFQQREKKRMGRDKRRERAVMNHPSLG